MEYAFSYDISPFLDQGPHGNDYHANSVVIITTGVVIITTGTLV